jgi:hypothetical protein
MIIDNKTKRIIMNLPERPEKTSDQTQEEYEEILGFWMHRVGRLKNMRGIKQAIPIETLEDVAISPQEHKKD